ncbi:MAG: sensor histidine kinase [Solirubrobacteraceae bacterium]
MSTPPPASRARDVPGQGPAPAPAPISAALRAPTARAALPRLRVGQWLGLTIGSLLAFAVLGVGLALIANQHLGEQRRVVLAKVEPALHAALELETALVNEESGVRGYLLSGKRELLEPYGLGRVQEARAYTTLQRLSDAGGQVLARDAQAVQARARAWQQQFALPILHTSPKLLNDSHTRVLAGKTLFDSIRARLGRLHSDLARRLASSERELSSDADLLKGALLVAAALILSSLIGAGLLLRRILTRPLAALGRDTEQVAAGDFARPIAIVGAPREIVQLGGEIESMRRQIVHELATVQAAGAALEAQAIELSRSNAELEQFAYVASHDLQEPLRKVASFCQALERRYHGQLDERADQYIEFAVDGAKRMQLLINDLLAFSRVGRSGHTFELLALGDILEQAISSLSRTIAENGASVESQALPTVRGERTLLVSLFQNLISNAVKFRGSQAPVVRLAAERQGDQWQLSCTDNGIGVEAGYAERIFLIFQRLHSKEAYAGSGIGLAMCRKIVEYHGGRMWLEPGHSPGARFLFTLPVATEPTANEEAP